MMHMKRAIIAGLNVPCEEERDEKEGVGGGLQITKKKESENGGP